MERHSDRRIYGRGWRHDQLHRIDMQVQEGGPPAVAMFCR
jgi:hypothetical protein